MTNGQWKSTFDQNNFSFHFSNAIYISIATESSGTPKLTDKTNFQYSITTSNTDIKTAETDTIIRTH